MANRRDICSIPECDETVRYIHLGVCAACYSGLARWRGRPIGAKRLMMGRYKRLESRMDFIMENPKHHPVRRDDLDHGDRRTRR